MVLRGDIGYSGLGWFTFSYRAPSDDVLKVQARQFGTFWRGRHEGRSFSRGTVERPDRIKMEQLGVMPGGEQSFAGDPLSIRVMEQDLRSLLDWDFEHNYEKVELIGRAEVNKRWALGVRFVPHEGDPVILQNQTDIGNAVARFYGQPAGEKLTGLLKDHILGAAALIEAAKSGDKPKIDAAAAKWYANGDEIATFLNGANPQNWPLADMKAGMKMHLDLTLKEATDRLQGKYADDIKDYDQVHQHILGLADLLSSGIEKQFPKKFSKS
jgi:hypothetical protein